jgi:hypothetical protein
MSLNLLVSVIVIKFQATEAYFCLDLIKAKRMISRLSKDKKRFLRELSLVISVQEKNKIYMTMKMESAFTMLIETILSKHKGTSELCS